MATITRTQNQPDPALGGLSPVQYANQMMARFYATTCLPQSTQAGHFSEIKNGHLGQKIVVPQVPDIEIRDLVIGRPRPLKTEYAPPLELEIKFGTEWSCYFPDEDLYFQQTKDFQQKILKGGANTNAAYIEKKCFARFPSFVPAWNCGNTAGKESGGYKLGTAENPAIVTKNNIMDYLAQFLSCVEETNIGMESGVFSIIVPTQLGYLLRTSADTRDASKSGGPSSLKTRKIPTLLEHDIYASNLLTKVNGAWPILAYTKEALAFAMAVKKVRSKEPDRVDGLEIYGKSIYGFDVERKDGCVLGYVKSSVTDITLES